MKITILFLTKHMDTGGGEFVLYSLMAGLPQDQFESIMVCLNQKGVYGEKLTAEGFIVYDHVLRRQSDLGVLPRLLKIVHQHQVNVIYLMDYRDTMLWGPLVARWARIPSILATHCTSWWQVRDLTALGTLLLSWHANIIAIAEFQKEYLVRERRLSANKITVIPNGINYEKFAYPSECLVNLPKLPEFHFIVGTVCSLHIGKNVEMLLCAIRRLHQANRSVHALIIGDGPERSKLEAYSRELGVEQRVQFLGSRSDVPHLLHLIDAFVLTSKFEVMPLSIIEAMAAGRPVISTAVGSVPQIVGEGRTGYTVPVGDDHALADALGQLMDSPDLRKQMGERATARASQEYSLQTMIDRNAAVIHQVVL